MERAGHCRGPHGIPWGLGTGGAGLDPCWFHPPRLFGPKRKMTSAIARWHSSARPPSDALELAYADRLEAEMQELAIQLHKVRLLGPYTLQEAISAVFLLCL